MDELEETYLNLDLLESLCTDVPQLVERFGLGKLLMVRKLVIYYKNVLKYYFLHVPREELEALLRDLGMDYHDFMVLAINRLRRILKVPRYLSLGQEELKATITNDFENRRFFSSLSGLGAMLVTDLDGVLTSERPRTKVREIIKLANPRHKVVITASGKEEGDVKRLLAKFGFDPSEWQVVSVRGMLKKVRRLKTIAIMAINPVVIYLDDEERYLRYSSLLMMLSYRVERSGRMRRYPPMK